MRLFLFFFLYLLGGLFADDDPLTRSLPPVPEDGVFDPSRWLTNDSKLKIVRNIQIAKSKWDAEIYVLIQAEQPEIDAELWAKGSAQKWGEGRLWGIVLHVVGDPNSPRFFAGRKDSFGWSEDQESSFSQSLDKALDDVVSRAMREEGQRLRVETGAREFCDELGYLGLVMNRIEKRYDHARGLNSKVVQKKQENRNFLKTILMVLVPLILLVIVIIIYLLRKRREESKFNFFFPETTPRKRFLAPWSGGGDVIVNVGSRLGEDGSRKG